MEAETNFLRHWKRRLVLFTSSIVLLLFCLAWTIPVSNSKNKDEAKGFDKSTFYIGASYYPEWWAEERWEEDFKKMQELGFNCVRMGEFAWSKLEPSQGNYDFGWMERAINLAAKYGIKTILCTPTATQPPWLRSLDPGILGADSRGSFKFGARKGYCTNNSTLLLHNDKIVEALAEYFSDNENIVSWQLDNEPGYPFSCLDENCRHSFHNWLEKKYKHIDTLNYAWGNAFWSHWYSDWHQIEFPAIRGDGSWNPSHELDYRRFFSDSYQTYLKRQTVILREKISGVSIFTNWPNTFWSVDTYEAASDFLDATAWDNYNVMPGISDYRRQFGGSGIHHDMSRCAGPNQQFLIAEQAAQVPPVANSDGIRVQTYIDMAHGARGVVYFEWRPPVGGSEQGYISVLNLDGTFGPAEEQYRKMGEELKRIAPILGETKTEAPIAMIYDYDNSWHGGFWKGVRHPGRNGKSPVGYDQEVRNWYMGFKDLKNNIDVIPLHREFSKYRMIVAPRLAIVSDEQAAELNNYVENGGILVLNTFAGTRHIDNKLREVLAPGVFGKAAGIRVIRTANKGAMAGNYIEGIKDENAVVGYKIKFNGSDSLFKPNTLMDEIELQGAEVLAIIKGGNMEGKPAVTINKYGKGYIVYAGADCADVTYYETIAQLIAERFDIRPIIDAPKYCEVVSRTNGKKEYVFVINLIDKELSYPLPEEMKELVEDTTESGKVKIDALGVKIYERNLK